MGAVVDILSILLSILFCFRDVPSDVVPLGGVATVQLRVAWLHRGGGQVKGLGVLTSEWPPRVPRLVSCGGAGRVAQVRGKEGWQSRVGCRV